MKYELKGRVDRAYDPKYDDEIAIEFGRIQGSFWISSKGKAARKLNLKAGQKILVTIEGVE